MSYQSPIELIMSDMQVKMEGEILKAVQNVGVNVDKDELLKALQFNRNQYQKGYDDRDSEIVRCKDCEHYCEDDMGLPFCNVHESLWLKDDWFCADGERKNV